MAPERPQDPDLDLGLCSILSCTSPVHRLRHLDLDLDLDLYLCSPVHCLRHLDLDLDLYFPEHSLMDLDLVRQRHSALWRRQQAGGGPPWMSSSGGPRRRPPRLTCEW